jgi:phosphoribosyl-AMP cyclohydrolase
VTSPTAELPFLSEIKWTADGLVPALVQDVESGEVLMMAWMDEAALRRTLETGQTHFYSRSRRSAWHKGGTSGHVQEVDSVFVDCDADVILIKARQVGGACHEGYRSCFYRKVDRDGGLQTVADRVFDSESVYGSGASQPSAPSVSAEAPPA